MPPKIEVLEDEPIEAISPTVDNSQKPPKKNPFATSTKKSTVRVDPSSIQDTSYRNSTSKGLNVPGIKSSSPIDVLFTELETKIMGCTLSELNFEETKKRIGDVTTRLELVRKLMKYLIEIQILSVPKDMKGEEGEKDQLITISLHDIRTFSRLVNLIIIHGVYPALQNYSIGIPLEKRRLKDFSKGGVAGNSGSDDIKVLLCDKGEVEPLLNLMFDEFYKIFTSVSKSSVKDLLLRGTGFSDFLAITLALLTIPSISAPTKARISKVYPAVLAIPDTFELYQTFSLLLSSPSPIYLKSFVSSQLQLLHVNAPRKDGLLTLCEFVLGLRENEEVDISKFDQVANVVLTKPKDINTIVYFTSIGNQSYDLLVNINKPVVNSCICYTLEKLWDRNNKIVIDFMIKRIWNKFNPQVPPYTVSEVEVNNNLNVLISLTKNNPSPTLLMATFEPILLQIWSYYIFIRKTNGKSLSVVKGVLVSYFTIIQEQIGESRESLDKIAKNCLCDGGDNWEFSKGKNGLVEITPREVSESPVASKEIKMNSFLNSLDIAIPLYIELLTDLDESYVQSEFMAIFKRWLKVSGDNSIPLEKDFNPFFMLIDLRLLEGIGEKFKDSLGRSPLEMLEIVDTYLSKDREEKAHPMDVDSDDEDSDDEVEQKEANAALPILLQLLSAILSETSTSELSLSCFDILKQILPKLKAIDSPSAKAAAQSLYERITNLVDGDTLPKSSKSMVHEQNVKMLKLAITSLNDPLVPIRAHGLHILRNLIEAKCEDVVSLDFVVELHLNQLRDPEPFIYLNVIKGLEQLVKWNEKEVIPIYVSLYTSTENELDERLRIGEVLLRYIQASNELFVGKTASIVVEGALSLIRRSDDKEVVDTRLRNSAMSILGVCCMVNPLGMIDNVGNALDCALGILKLETSNDEAVMRRAAIVLIHDLIIGTSNSPGLPFPEEYRAEVWKALEYIYSTDNDLLVREQAKVTLNTIEELAKDSFEVEGADHKYKKLQVL
ncbi:RNA polymerase II assembly factor Rtp1p [[Candida] railenensis]|uniref:RNA polymerase II assembly factor Rtp1p n=1 Tax=[Candida] railenensis TaxID=45579 RepID=A0A9P0QSZ1_9ASCO|nr:RNA polymerase II assembly factor Rtp1p [[Candida] railenensis]